MAHRARPAARRTPLAVLRAQWDVVRRSPDGPQRTGAEQKFEAGLERMARLVTQMLSLSRVESGAPSAFTSEVNWPRIVEQAVNDCLALSQRRHIDIACEWPPAGTRALLRLGDENLLVILLRNLLDNAVRYAPEGSDVLIRIGPDSLDVENAGPPFPPEQVKRLGERFYRPDGQAELGSGLGISIVRHIAGMHSLSLAIGPRADGQGVRFRLEPTPGSSGHRASQPTADSRVR